MACCGAHAAPPPQPPQPPRPRTEAGCVPQEPHAAAAAAAAAAHAAAAGAGVGGLLDILFEDSLEGYVACVAFGWLIILLIKVLKLPVVEGNSLGL